MTAILTDLVFRQKWTPVRNSYQHTRVARERISQFISDGHFRGCRSMYVCACRCTHSQDRWLPRAFSLPYSPPTHFSFATFLKKTDYFGGSTGMSLLMKTLQVLTCQNAATVQASYSLGIRSLLPKGATTKDKDNATTHTKTTKYKNTLKKKKKTTVMYTAMA